jgi:hypothetical protein
MAAFILPVAVDASLICWDKDVRRFDADIRRAASIERRMRKIYMRVLVVGLSIQKDASISKPPRRTKVVREKRWVVEGCIRKW